MNIGALGCVDKGLNRVAAAVRKEVFKVSTDRSLKAKLEAELFRQRQDVRRLQGNTRALAEKNAYQLHERRIAELEEVIRKQRLSFQNLQSRVNRLGVEIDGALRGRMPVETCQRERLQMIVNLKTKCVEQELETMRLKGGV